MIIILYLCAMKVLYYVVYALFYLLSLLPLSIHYVISDVLYFILYRIVRYRRTIVRKNLSSSFPEKSEAELLQIERDFYHFFCDYLVETVKMLTISHDELTRRMVFKGTETVEQIVSEGQSCAVYLGHYCNWEWISSLPLWVTPEAQCGQIYHPLENREIDRLFLKLRQRMGATCIPMAESLRYIIGFQQQKRPVIVGYISDQVPLWTSIHHWCNFLNHDTPVLSGTERIARKLNHAIFYLDVHRVRRGYYEAEFKLVARNPKSMPEFALTDTYFRMLEDTIRQAPAYWLWSHNRWKRTREEFNRRLDPKTGKVRLGPLDKIESL